jgi:methionine-rich copper-binding protein CopC
VTVVRLLVVAGGLAVLLGGAASAAAHAFLDRAEPRVGSTTRVAPSEVRLWFTERLEPAFSQARVVTSTGQQVNAASGEVDAANPKLIRIPLPALPAGAYRVIWRVLSVDSHVTEGDFTFRIAP